MIKWANEDSVFEAVKDTKNPIEEVVVRFAGGKDYKEEKGGACCSICF